MKTSKPAYLEKVQLLSEEEKERLLSRMAGKLPRRLEKDKLSLDEALAIQLELEDEQLQEWRKKMLFLQGQSKAEEAARDEEKSKAAKKLKVKAEDKAGSAEKAPGKVKSKAGKAADPT